jgi:hypothetical protein
MSSRQCTVSVDVGYVCTPLQSVVYEYPVVSPDVISDYFVYLMLL